MTELEVLNAILEQVELLVTDSATNTLALADLLESVSARLDTLYLGVVLVLAMLFLLMFFERGGGNVRDVD